MAQPQTTRDVIYNLACHIRGKVLDVGSGSAKYGEFIKDHCTNYETIDKNPNSSAAIIGDAENMPIDDEQYDTVICNQLLEHVPHPSRVITEIHRVLRNKGVCILTAPFLAAYHKDPEDYFRYTLAGLEVLFEEAGFQTIDKGTYTPRWSTAFQFLEFVYFSPYRPNQGGWAKRIARLGLRLARVLDRNADEHVFYGNSYIVAQKA